MAPEPFRTPALRLLSATLSSTLLLFALATPAHALRYVAFNILNYPGTTGPARDPFYRTILAPLARGRADHRGDDLAGGLHRVPRQPEHDGARPVVCAGVHRRQRHRLRAVLQDRERAVPRPVGVLPEPRQPPALRARLPAEAGRLQLRRGGVPCLLHALESFTGLRGAAARRGDRLARLAERHAPGHARADHRRLQLLHRARAGHAEARRVAGQQHRPGVRPARPAELELAGQRRHAVRVDAVAVQDGRRGLRPGRVHRRHGRPLRPDPAHATRSRTAPGSSWWQARTSRWATTACTTTTASRICPRFPRAPRTPPRCTR